MSQAYMSEMERAIYLAGVLDIEGCFTSILSADGRKEKHRYPLITVTHQDVRLLEWIKTHYGGYIYILKNKYRCRNGNRLIPCYEWQLQGRRAKNLAELVKPFLIIKDKQVNNCLEVICEYCASDILSRRKINIVRHR